MSQNHKPTLIEASAGTGKTYQITKQIVERIMGGLTVDQLMVVTFTEKSARDMKGRIRKGIEDRLQSSDLPSLTNTESANLRTALSQFDEASIGTIHSIAHELLQQYQIEHGLSISTNLSDSDSELCNELVEAQLLRLLGIDHDSSWYRVISRTYLKDFKTILEKLIKEMITHQRQNSGGSYQYDHLGVYLLTSNAQDRANLDLYVERDRFCKYFDLGHASTFQLLHDINNEPEPISLNQGTLKFLKSLLAYKIHGKCNDTLVKKTKDSSFDHRAEVILKQFSKTLFDQELMPTSEATVFKAAKHWKKLFAERILNNFILDRSSIEHLNKRINERKTQLDELSFDELLIMFVEASQKDQFKEAVQSRYKLVCIDEFQDTNLLQWHSFQALFTHSECELLLVGDPKQAIYAFRGGDVHTYNQVKANTHLGDRLEHNFRSTPPLLSALNRLFSEKRHEFDEQPTDTLTLEVPLVRYPADKKHFNSNLSPKDQEIDLDGRLNVRTIYPKGEAAFATSGLILTGWMRQNIGHYVARDLINLFKSYKPKTKDDPEFIRRSTCAILVNTNREARSIQWALDQWEIESALVIDESIWATPAASYLILWLDALLNIDDEGKVIGALSTPFFGFDHLDAAAEAQQTTGQMEALKDLSQYAKNWLKTGNPLRIYKEYEKTLGEDTGKDTGEDTGEDTTTDSSSKKDTYCYIKKLLKSPRGHELILHLKHLLTLLQQKSDSEGLSVQAQLAYLKFMYQKRSADDQGNLDYPTEEQINYQLNSDVVQIITIHKSKGLEFEYVFCPALWNKVNNDASNFVINAQKPIWEGFIDKHSHDQYNVLDSLQNDEEDEGSFTKLLIRFVDRADTSHLKNEVQAENDAEKLRKLYVAFTRASRELYLYYSLVNDHVKGNMALRLIGFPGSKKMADCSFGDCSSKSICKDCKHLSLINHVDQLTAALNISSPDELDQLITLPSGDHSELRQAIYTAVQNSVQHKKMQKVPKPSKIDLAVSTQSSTYEIPEISIEQILQLPQHNQAWNSWSYSGIFRGKANIAIKEQLDPNRAQAPRENDESSAPDINLSEQNPDITESLSDFLIKRGNKAHKLFEEAQSLGAPLLDKSYLPRELRAQVLGNFIHDLFEDWDLETKRLDTQHGEQQKWIDRAKAKELEGLPIIKWAALCRALLSKLEAHGYLASTLKAEPTRLMEALNDRERLIEWMIDEDENEYDTQPEAAASELNYNPMLDPSDEQRLLNHLKQDLIKMATTPLGGPLKGTTLASLDSEDVIHELEFDFAIGQGLLEEGSIQAKELLEFGHAEDQVSRYVTQMMGLQKVILKGRESSKKPGEEGRQTHIAGMMNGKIDLIMRKTITLTDSQGHSSTEKRYFIADYKTNNIPILAPPQKILSTEDQEESGESSPQPEKQQPAQQQEEYGHLIAYEPHYLGAQMLKSHYHLQGHIYLVALHRYLKQRLGTSYDYDRHIGGYYYLYCRGMVGPNANIIDRLHSSQHFAKKHGGSLGVYYYRPPKERIEALSHKLTELSSQNTTLNVAERGDDA